MELLTQHVIGIVVHPALLNSLQVSATGFNGKAVVMTGQNLATQRFKKRLSFIGQLISWIEYKNTFNGLQGGIARIISIQNTRLS